MCCLQKVKWKARFVSIRGKKYKLGWFGNNDGIGSVGILVNCKKFKEKVRVRAMMLVLGEEV